MRKAVVVGIDDYMGEKDDLPSCVADARLVARLLRDEFGFSFISELHDENATLDAVSSSLGHMMADAEPNDRLVFYFSGHGTQTERNDELRESLCLHDRLFHDDVLVDASQTLPPGILTVVLDSCFSGGMSKDFARAAKIKARQVALKTRLAPLRYRAFGVGARRNPGPVIAANRKFIAEKIVEETGPRLNGLLISACLENETAAASTGDTEGLSAFTFALRRALNELGARAPVEALITHAARVLRSINIVQSPQLHPPTTPELHRLPLFLAGDVRPSGSTAVVRSLSGDELLDRVTRLSAKAALSVAS